MLSLRNISCWFSSTNVLALDSIHLDIPEAEILGIVGENGAGKSTLMRIASGHLLPSSGSILVDRELLRPGSIEQAKKRGLVLLPQYPSFAEDLRLIDDAILSGALSARLWSSQAALYKKWQELGESYGILVDPKKKAANASPAERQMARLLGLLAKKPRFLILDEVSALLESEEREGLYRIVSNLKAEGTAVIMVSHRLDEIVRLCDRCIVLRQGKIIADVYRDALSESHLSQLMFAAPSFPASEPRSANAHHIASERSTGEQTLSAYQSPAPFKAPAESAKKQDNIIFQLKAVSTQPPSLPALHCLDLSLKAGSITGIGGLRESGLTSLEQLIAGGLPADSGDILLAGNPLCLAGQNKKASPSQRIARARLAGLAWTGGEGITSMKSEQLSIAESAAILNPAHYAKKHLSFLIDAPLVQQSSARLLAKARISARPNQGLSTLSGGSQRRLAVFRELSKPSQLFLASEPFWGLDSRSIEELKGLFKEYLGTVPSSDGKERPDHRAVLLLSVDCQALINYCDRFIILKDGIFTSDHLLSDRGSRDRLLRALPELLLGKQIDEAVHA